MDLRDELRRARLMAITPVDEVWGIGRRLGAKLVAQGICSGQLNPDTWLGRSSAFAGAIP